MARDGRLTGGCQCDAVPYALTAMPTQPSVCHCRICQKVGGGPYMVFTGVRLSQIEWQGEPKTFSSSSIGERGFCADCGTPLNYRLHGRDRISVMICSLDDPETVPPLEQNGIEPKLAWVDGVRDLPARRTQDCVDPERARVFASHQRSDLL